jgi:hypothetical protein
MSEEVIPSTSRESYSEQKKGFVCKDDFDQEIQKISDKKKERDKPLWTTERIGNVIKLVEEYKSAPILNKSRNRQQYYYGTKYDVMNIGQSKVLILKRQSESDSIVEIVAAEDYYRVLMKCHESTGHGGQDKMLFSLKSKYFIPTQAVITFIKLCRVCSSKKTFPKKGIVVRPITSTEFNSRGQVDLIDLQSTPDERYKWLLHYQDHLTKFTFLRPLTSKRAAEVAFELLKIFLEVGCPNILQSDNGREFTAAIIKELVSMWPSCKIVNGRPRHPASQGSVERANQDVENMLRSWLADNNSKKWSIGCYFVQFQKNSSFHRTIQRTPYKALFGTDPKVGLESTHIPANILNNIRTEEDLEEIFLTKDVENTHETECTEWRNNEGKQMNNERGQMNVEECSEERNNEGGQMHVEECSEERNNEGGQLNVEECSEERNNEGGQINVEECSEERNNEGGQMHVEECSEERNNDGEQMNEEERSEERNNEREQINVEEGLQNIQFALLQNVQWSMQEECSIEKTIAEKLMCRVCNNESNGAHSCQICNQAIHAICGDTIGDEGYGSKVICFLCSKEKNVIQERNEAYNNQVKCAVKMKSASLIKFGDVKVNDTVLVDIPKVDRGPLGLVPIIHGAVPSPCNVTTPPP